MNTRVYRLLRNNKEEGPFTVEELIQKKLRPYDLIWIDGRSAAWSYPGELAQFKNYVPLPGAKNNNQTEKAQPAISSSIQAAIAIDSNISQAKEKPRYKVSAAWSKIQTITMGAANNIKPENEQQKPPKKPMVVNHLPGTPLKSLSWEEAWQDWENQKDTVQDMQEPATAKPSPTKPAAIKKPVKPVPETKYAAPPDSLKDQYIENILEQKQKLKTNTFRGKAIEFLLPAIALVIIFSAAYWLLNDTEVPPLSTAAVKKVQASHPANTTVSTEPVNVNTPKQEEVVVPGKQQKLPATAMGIPQQAAERKISKVRLPKHYDKPEKIVDDNVAEDIPASTTNNTKAEMPARVETNNVTDNGTTLTKTNASPEAADNTGAGENNMASRAVINENKVNAPLKKITTDYVHAPAHIEMNNGIANIKIENVSNVDFDLVVVDVQYYSASNNFRKGETLYLHNLRAGRNVVIKTPKDFSSSYATSKISLISSDAKQLYVIGEN